MTWKKVGLFTLCSLVLGLIAGWMLRSADLNDDYQELAPRHRPAGVPENAFWAGGQDGGAYIDCYYLPEEDVDACTIYDDWTGKIGVEGKYVDSETGRGVRSDGLRYSFFDGGVIYLENRKGLARIPALILKGTKRSGGR